ncbi:hypothetical protein Ancab_023376 [Ancistrocladus abbreviatus]
MLWDKLKGLEHTYLKMSWSQFKFQQRDGFNFYPAAPLKRPPLPPPQLWPSSQPSSGIKISPAVLFIFVVLAVVFFISGLLHLLVRFLTKHPFASRNSRSNGFPEISASDALQRQLQQLFNLHDSGLDQAFIDALPVFLYREIVGPKEPFDCAVCLSEFSEKDRLRLLPLCGHAFHMSCIDTWLLSNSTCPLCRGTLFNPGFCMQNPIFDFDEPVEEDDRSAIGENGLSCGQKAIEIDENAVDKKGVFPVRLGKFRKSTDGSEEPCEGETSNHNLDTRRCYSMGSYQYVVGDNSLKVALCPGHTRRSIKHVKGSEHTGDSSSNGGAEAKKTSVVLKGDSYSISKIWLWPKRGKYPSSSNAHLGIQSSSLSKDLPRTENV